MGSVKIKAVNACIVSASDPDKHSTAKASIANVAYLTSPSEYLYIIFNRVLGDCPQELYLKHPSSVDIYLAASVIDKYDVGFFPRADVYWVPTSTYGGSFKTITWNNMGSQSFAMFMTPQSSGSGKKWYKFSMEISFICSSLVDGTMAIASWNPYGDDEPTRIMVYGPGSDADPDYSPYIVCNYDDSEAVNPVLKNLAPASGFVGKTVENTFSWSLGLDDVVYWGSPEQTSATFQWRAGSSGTVNSISVGTAMSCTVPGGTFKTDEIQWRVTAVTNAGTVTSDWMTLSTVEALSDATIIEPKSTVVDNTRDITLRWNHIISTGTGSTGYDVEYSADGSSFVSLASNHDTDELSCVVPAGTLSAGPTWWRVRTYNTDHAAGNWSEVVQITVIAAPVAPVLSVTSAVPRAVIAWQVTGQAAYEYYFDQNTDTHYVFGVATSQRCPYVLSNGSHVAAVRVQNQYGLWSPWSTVSFTVTNATGAAITLAGVGGETATLRWSTEGEYDYFVLYRNNLAIFKGADTAYTDNLISGDSNYFVRGFAGENYTDSEVLAVNYRISNNMIASVDGFAWLRLRLSDTDLPVVTTTRNRKYSSTYYSGYSYPALERTEFKGLTVSFSTAFSSASEARLLENLIGEIVCVKTVGGDVVVGILGAVTKSVNAFYRVYGLTVTQIDWDEEVSLDD